MLLLDIQDIVSGETIVWTHNRRSLVDMRCDGSPINIVSLLLSSLNLGQYGLLPLLLTERFREFNSWSSMRLVVVSGDPGYWSDYFLIQLLSIRLKFVNIRGRICVVIRLQMWR